MALGYFAVGSSLSKKNLTEPNLTNLTKFDLT